MSNCCQAVKIMRCVIEVICFIAEDYIYNKMKTTVLILTFIALWYIHIMITWHFTLSEMLLYVIFNHCEWDYMYIHVLPKSFRNASGTTLQDIGKWMSSAKIIYRQKKPNHEHLFISFNGCRVEFTWIWFSFDFNLCSFQFIPLIVSGKWKLKLITTAVRPYFCK